MSKSLVPLALDYSDRFSAFANKSRNSKETYRLWYEYLDRARCRLDLTINTDYYRVWNLRENEQFYKWWERTGQNVTVDKNKIPAVVINPDNINTISPSTHINIAIPFNLTATEAGELVRKLLLSNNFKRQSIIDYPEIRKGAEIRHLSLRSYLICYDCYQAMLHNTSKVSYIELLKYVRRAYSLQYKLGKKLKDRLPSTLCGIGPDPKSFEHVSTKDDSQALATLRRYIIKADQIIRSVAEGHFPD